MLPTSRRWTGRKSVFNKIRTREYTGRTGPYQYRRHRQAFVLQRAYRHPGSRLRREISRRIKRRRDADRQLLEDYRTVMAAYERGGPVPYIIDAPPRNDPYRPR